MPQTFDITSASTYVRSLFRFILNRTAPNEDDVNYWANFLLENQDPNDLLVRFGTSVEATSRLQKLESAVDAFPSGHFYSPIVNIPEIVEDSGRLFTRHRPLGVDMNIPMQEQVFQELCRNSGNLPFSDEKANGLRYYYNNTSYAFGDAFGYWGMLAYFRPSQIIEVGSGFTSALALDAIDLLALQTVCTFVDPYPDLLLKVAAPIDKRHKVIADRIQAVSPDLVEGLGPGDFLFIDSSHVVKSGSDVQFELMELLPRLASGVVVHFHDVFDSFEYPRPWVVDQKLSWNEIYVLHAFLMYNQVFEIIYFNDFFARNCPESFNCLSPIIIERLFTNPGGGLWLRRK